MPNLMDLIPAEWRPGTPAWEAMCQGARNGLAVLLATLGLVGVIAIGGSTGSGSTGGSTPPVVTTTSSMPAPTTSVKPTPTTTPGSTTPDTTAPSVPNDSQVVLYRQCFSSTSAVGRTAPGITPQPGDTIELFVNGVAVASGTTTNGALGAATSLNGGPITLKGVLHSGGKVYQNQQSFPACA